MCLLHALGSALIASGIAALFLINGPLRRGARWAAIAIALVVVLSDGVNALQIYLFGGFHYWVFWIPLTFVGFVLLGLVLACVPPALFPPESEKVANKIE
jgi:amino acid permease